MAHLPLGKLTILVGAGLLGSVIAKEGLPDVSGLLSGAKKIAFRQVKSDDSSPSAKKPNSDLIAQVNSLRQQLLSMKSNGPVTIITTNGGTGSKKYGIIIVIMVVGYGYVRWKGWKLPENMMFATKRGLSDACNYVAKRLENLYASLESTERQLSSEIARVDSRLDEDAEVRNAIREEANALRERSTTIDQEFLSVRDAVESLGLRLSRFEGNQGFTLQGIKHLCDYAHAHSRENNMLLENIQAFGSSSQITFSTRVESLPAPNHESQSPPVSNGNPEIRRLLQHATSSPIQQGSGGISGLADISRSHVNSNGGNIHAAERSDSRPLNLNGPTFLHRARSVTGTVLQRTGSGRQ